MDRQSAMKVCRTIPGWMADNELEWLYDKAQEVPAGGIWVELGSLKGRSLVATGLGLKEGCELWAVDTYRWHPEDCIECLKNIRWLQEKKPKLKVGLIVADATFASGLFAAGSVSTVFIDADHSYEAVKSQIAAWMPTLTPRGRLCGHDFNSTKWPGVRPAVMESLSGVEAGPFSIWDHRVFK
jgi:hypothetical protein